MRNEVRAVLFDVAGTLAELREPVGRTYARFAARHGGEFDAAELETRFVGALRAAPPRVFPGLDATAVADHETRWWRDVVWRTLELDAGTPPGFDFEGCFDALFAAYAGAGTWRARAGAHAALAALRDRGLRTGVVSNFDHRLPNLLEALELQELLDVVLYPARCGSAKPDGAIFAAALDALGVPAGAAAYVGDDPENDLAAAARAGLRAVAVPERDLRELPARVEALATLDRHAQPGS